MSGSEVKTYRPLPIDRQMLPAAIEPVYRPGETEEEAAAARAAVRCGAFEQMYATGDTAGCLKVWEERVAALRAAAGWRGPHEEPPRVLIGGSLLGSVAVMAAIFLQSWTLMTLGVLAVWLTVMVWGATASRRPRHAELAKAIEEGRCPGCGYDLTSSRLSAPYLPEACAECGASWPMVPPERVR